MQEQLNPRSLPEVELFALFLLSEAEPYSGGFTLDQNRHMAHIPATSQTVPVVPNQTNVFRTSLRKTQKYPCTLFCLSLLLSLSFDLQLHKGSRNAKMLAHSTGVLPLFKLFGCPFSPINTFMSFRVPPPPSAHPPTPPDKPQSSLYTCSFHSSSQDQANELLSTVYRRHTRPAAFSIASLTVTKNQEALNNNNFHFLHGLKLLFG